MAAPASHRVQRLLLELAGAAPAGAAALQAVAQRQLQQLLLPLLDTLCSQLGDPGTVQRIDQLQIDLGAWPLAAWADSGGDAQALAAHFQSTLARQLGQALQAATPVQADAELVASCLHTGQLPWWADGADRGALQRALAALLAGPVQHGMAWLPPADADAPALQRLVAALDDAQLAGLVGRLGGRQNGRQGSPQTAGAQGRSAPAGMQRLPDAAAWPWQALLSGCAQALGLTPGRLRQAWWREALAAALQPGPGAAQAWATALQRLPARLGLGAGVLAPAWRRALDQASGAAQPGALAPLWQALDQAWPPARAGGVVGVDTRQDADAATAAGRRAAPTADAAVASLAGLADALAQQPGGAPARAWLPWLQALCQQPQADAARRLAAALAGGGQAAQATAALQQWLDGVPLPAGMLPAQRAAAAAALAALLLASLAQTAAQTAAQPAAQPAARSAAWAQTGPAALPKPPSGAPKPAAPLPAADALYPANAGLVLLWPFLQRFADRLGLLQDRQFRSPAHAVRLALLLQVLATGDADPPEFQLPLNKLLCGLPPDTPILPDEALRSDEQDECAALLAAVVQGAPVLRQMSADGLRQAFLQRSGQLSTQDGHWQLRVERATHDVVLDRFPWSWSIVRLPWMPRLLQVHW